MRTKLGLKTCACLAAVAVGGLLFGAATSAQAASLSPQAGYVCYNAEDASMPPQVRIDLKDLINSYSDKNAEPVMICLQAHLNGGGGVNPNNALVCYRLQNGVGGAGNLVIKNDLDKGRLTAQKARTVCLHSVVKKP